MAARDSSTLANQAEQEFDGLDDQAGADVAQGMYALGGHFAMQGSVMQIPPSMLQDAGNEATEGGPELSMRDQGHDARRSQTADVTLAAYSAGIARYQDFSISIGGEEMDAEELENYSENILDNKEDVREELEAQGYTEEEIQEFFEYHEYILEALEDGRLSEAEERHIRNGREDNEQKIEATEKIRNKYGLKADANPEAKNEGSINNKIDNLTLAESDFKQFQKQADHLAPGQGLDTNSIQNITGNFNCCSKGENSNQEQLVADKPSEPTGPTANKSDFALDV